MGIAEEGEVSDVERIEFEAYTVCSWWGEEEDDDEEQGENEEVSWEHWRRKWRNLTQSENGLFSRMGLKPRIQCS